MEIKAADVMKLRKMTGAGMMDCKKALIEAEGDYARAQDIIREKGKLVVAKRADRTASEGVVVTKIVGQKAYILCLACETDFVAQNAEYTASAEAMLEVAVAADAADRDALLATKNAEGHTVEEMVTEKSGQTGEKIELAYYARIEAPYCAAYVHFNKKLGTLLGFNKEVPAEVAHTVAMQATAMAPVSISEADCPAEVVEHERKIAVEAMKQDPKNANKPGEDRRGQDAQVLRGEYAAEPDRGWREGDDRRVHPQGRQGGYGNCLQAFRAGRVIVPTYRQRQTGVGRKPAPVCFFVQAGAGCWRFQHQQPSGGGGRGLFRPVRLCRRGGY